MSHGVLAGGVVVLLAAGNVWYLPAYIDLRAGQDRPRSRRPAAAAVLTGWGTVPLTLLLLLLPVAPGLAVLPAVAGVTAVICLSVQSRLLRAQEQREEEARWSTLFPVRPRGGGAAQATTEPPGR
ncbi:hypothetical protein ACFCV8_10080 [Streptomyces sp. NPDC056347]|uniref:hypothetical protein n=1 Tax=unclassified Streptomyces TaxID=2593676 RepID=UPI0035D7A2A0